jgi:hypothetical protein
MLRNLATLFALSVLPILQASAIGTDDQVYSNISYGTFQTPSSNVRPRFRYWTNDASVNLTQVALDVANAGAVGAGGIELLGYYNYGERNDNLFTQLQSDWTVYGWGSPAWSKSFYTLRR